MVTAVEAWERYAERTRPRRAVNADGAGTWFNWTQHSDHGPNESVLGRVCDRIVLELGSGTGANLAHLAGRAADATCHGVDLAPSRTTIARQTWAHLPNLHFTTADALDFLTATSMSFDVVYSIFGAVWFTDPAVLLPMVRRRMATNGVFAFSQMPPPTEPSTAPQRVIRTWNRSARHWVQLLTEAGFVDPTAETIPAPAGARMGTLFVRALTR